MKNVIVTSMALSQFSSPDTMARLWGRRLPLGVAGWRIGSLKPCTLCAKFLKLLSRSLTREDICGMIARPRRERVSANAHIYSARRPP